MKQTLEEHAKGGILPGGCVKTGQTQGGCWPMPGGPKEKIPPQRVDWPPKKVPEPNVKIVIIIGGQPPHEITFPEVVVGKGPEMDPRYHPCVDFPDYGQIYHP